jgi:hypothetical protein
MLAHLGVLAYFGWKASWVGLLLLAPVCWFLPVRFAWLYLGLIVCNRLIWFAVLSQLETRMWLHFALGTLIFIPIVASYIVASYLVVTARKSKIRLRLKYAGLAAMFAAPVAVTLTLAPYWFDAVQTEFIESARAFAQGRLYCIVEPGDGDPRRTDVSIRELLGESTSFRGEFPRFYALLIIDAGPEMYWSFSKLTFINVPPTFGPRRSKKPCTPVADPFAAVAPPG